MDWLLHNKKGILQAVIVIAAFVAIYLNSSYDANRVTELVNKSQKAIAGELDSCADGSLVAPHLGYSGELSGRILIVSVWSDDANTCWDLSDPICAKRKSDAAMYLNTAARWIEKQALSYGRQVELVTSLSDKYAAGGGYVESKGEGNLSRTCKFSAVATQMNMAQAKDSISPIDEADSYIESIDVSHLLAQYDADGIVFVFLFNTDESCDAVSGAYAMASSADRPEEYVFEYTANNNSVEGPSSYAHELLHCFGVPDYYYPCDAQYFSVTKEFVEKLSKEQSDDIMFSVYGRGKTEYAYDMVDCSFTSADAWFLGLEDDFEDATKYNLRR